MAAPTYHLLTYKGSKAVKASTTYAGSAFTGTGNVLQIKTEGVKVSVNEGPMFAITFDDVAFIEAASTYMFDKNCVVAIANMTEVV